MAYAWQQQSLTDDAKQLFDLSRELYERFSTLGDYAIKLGTQITKTVSAYNKFASSLERRVLPTARKLQKIEPTEIIEEVPIIESDKGNVSELSAPEVVPADEGDTHLTASGDSLESGLNLDSAPLVPRALPSRRAIMTLPCWSRVNS